MNYGLYVSAAGALTSMHRLDVASNNLANVNTMGFKPDFPAIMQRDAERVEDGLLSIPSNRLLERLGGGVLIAPSLTSFTPAAPLETGNSLDVAILGDGFFTLESGRGSGEERLRFTRDGRFTIDPRGRLVTAASGLPVLDDGGAVIEVDAEQPVTISPAGEVQQGGATVARIGVASFPDPSALIKVGENQYQAGPGAGTRRESTSLLRAGAVEASGAEPIRSMLAVTTAAGDIRRNLQMVQMHDELLGRAINTFGRIG